MIDGEEEGRLAFLGGTRGLDPSLGPFLLVDIGGGSTELVIGGAAVAMVWVSWDLAQAGLIDPLRCAWGERPTRIGGRVWTIRGGDRVVRGGGARRAVDQQVAAVAARAIHGVPDDVRRLERPIQPLVAGVRQAGTARQRSAVAKVQARFPMRRAEERCQAQSCAQAGRVGTVTVATNMAGRGVDIILGGSPPDAEESSKSKAAGGLFVIGTERHDSRRIDNQLRGRTGRQGDPGKSKFYICLEDDLLRIFGGEFRKGDYLRFVAAEADFIALEVGVLTPEENPRPAPVIRTARTSSSCSARAPGGSADRVADRRPPSARRPGRTGSHR